MIAAECEVLRRDDEAIERLTQPWIVLYSASVDDFATVVCFLEHHEMIVEPRNVQCLVMGFRSAESAAQSASTKVRSCRSLRAICKPMVGVPFMYLSSLFKAWKSVTVGLCMCWQMELTANAMSGRVMDKYCKEPAMVR